MHTLTDDLDDELVEDGDGAMNTGELQKELGGEYGIRNIADRDGLEEGGPSTSRSVRIETA